MMRRHAKNGEYAITLIRDLIHNIEIDIIEYPQSNAPEVYPTYKLLQQLNPISQHIHLHLDKMGKIISVVNNQEIEDRWTENKRIRLFLNTEM